jgi:hypothetical protein
MCLYPEYDKVQLPAEELGLGDAMHHLNLWRLRYELAKVAVRATDSFQNPVSGQILHPV